MDFSERHPRSFRDLFCAESESSETEDGQTTQTHPHPPRTVTSNAGSSSSRPSLNQRPNSPYISSTVSQPSTLHVETTTTLAPGRRPRRNFHRRTRERGGSSSAITSASRADSGTRRGSSGAEDYDYENDSDLMDDSPEDLGNSQTWSNGTGSLHDYAVRDRRQPAVLHADDDAVDYAELDRRSDAPRTVVEPGCSWQSTSQDDLALNAYYNRFRSATLKRSREKFETVDDKSVLGTLAAKGAVAVIAYSSGTADPLANDVWPNVRDSAKLPARYYTINKSIPVCEESRVHRRLAKIPKTETLVATEANVDHGDVDRRRSKWKLPVELMELIADHLDRDDIKSMRLVSQELNHYVSQVIFTTAVVPFNTEIYGMLAADVQPDLKGKKNAKFGAPTYTWKNANGDDVYNGHGLDVFRGFGRHILRYGMSFEVNEDALSEPPEKSLTERHSSFWGSFDWPFEEYRRFADVAGLETAADETPRMKTAFSELSRVRELALSIDSGLGWLNGPDRSIRARILERAPDVFGTLKKIPDRRAQAQQELWEHIESCHRTAELDVKLANLYRLESSGVLSELRGANLLADDQPEMPFVDPHVIHAAMPHDSADSQVPVSFDNPEVLDRFVSMPASSDTGILFSSGTHPSEVGQLRSPIIPSNLTKAQKEWLLETEWAQRAFLSSYMLSVIDNTATFKLVHTLTITRLSDRYIPMLNRMDFWDSLPNLKNVTLMAIPSWRTVTKDEAGFVETPKVNPTDAIDPFYELLYRIVSRLHSITELTIGWATGGEHAEGMHARNKLLLPAPLVTIDLVMNQDSQTLQKALLQFPFVEHLTLKNCWITPMAVLQFAKLHDQLSLQHLVFNSVSLTAMLRRYPNGNPPVAANVHNPVPAFWANQWQGVQAANQAHNGLVQANAPGLILHHNLLLGNAAHQMTIQQNQGQGSMFNNAYTTQPNVFAQTNLFQYNVFSPANQTVPNAFNQGLPGTNNALNLGQNFQFHIQALQTHIQHLHNQAGAAFQPQLLALQAQLQTQLQIQAQNQVANQNSIVNHNNNNILQANNLANLFAQANLIQQQQHAVQPLVAQTAINAQTSLQSEPRPGSWMNVIDIITPGPNLARFGSQHSQADEARTTALQSIEFISCGYARLSYSQLDQSALDTANGVANFTRHPTLAKRYCTLAPAMLNSKFALLASIVQDVDATELAALNAGWFLEHGWKDAEEARAVEFDGCAPGGTGRFTGVVRSEDRLQTSAGDAN